MTPRNTNPPRLGSVGKVIGHYLTRALENSGVSVQEDVREEIAFITQTLEQADEWMQAANTRLLSLEKDLKP